MFFGLNKDLEGKFVLVKSLCMLSWYPSAHPRHSQGYLTVGMLHSDKFPMLTVKAWNGRLILIFINRCLQTKISDEKNQGHQCSVELLNAALAVQCLCRWFDLTERSGRYLEPTVAEEIYESGVKFLSTYLRLATDAVLDKKTRWKVIPKHHVFRHILEDTRCSLMNSRFYHCFRDEDFVGLCKRLAVRCHKGGLFEFRILMRYLLRLSTWQPGGWKKRHLCSVSVGAWMGLVPAWEFQQFIGTFIGEFIGKCKNRKVAGFDQLSPSDHVSYTKTATFP